MNLYGITIVSSAFLLFLVQPIIAKQILPWFGGSAAVWTVCVVFFQTVLLAGYAYAHALTRLTPRTQTFSHVALLVVSLASLPIVASSGWRPGPGSDPTWRIAALLAVTVGLPYFLLSSTGPLIQKWFADDLAMRPYSPRVYRLFALSNLGSLVGLLAYPFVVEPNASLQRQSWGWSVGYAGFAAACGACAWRVRSRVARVRPTVIADDAADFAADGATDGAADADADAVAPGAPRLTHYLFWLACAALGSMLLLAVTNHVTQNVASIPFLWVLPLTLYLLSFVVVFEGRGGRGWYVRRWWQGPVLAAAIAMAWTLSAQRGVLSLYIALPIFCGGLFVACVFCHGELAKTRPAAAYLTQFYLSLAAGGAAGGLFVALVAPKLFSNYWETPIALVGLGVVALLTTRERDVWRGVLGVTLGVIATTLILAAGGTSLDPAGAMSSGTQSTWPVVQLVLAAAIFGVATWKRVSVAIVVAAVACTGFYGLVYYRFLTGDTLQASRNFYGALRVKDSGTGEAKRRLLLHGVILHGDQYFAPTRRHQATSYYGPSSGIGLALAHLRPADMSLDVAMIGLGTGTLTAWGRSGDRYRIYELNQAVVEIARRDFSYLADSKADIAIAVGDARLSMEGELASGSPMLYDVIAVDAFSSDSIPIHLITREALDVYMRHLRPDGIVAFHVSNRFLRLAPVVAQLAADAQLKSIDVDDVPGDDVHLASEWVLVTRNQAFLDRDGIRQRGSAIDPVPGLPIWTDQFNNLFKILK